MSLLKAEQFFKTQLQNSNFQIHPGKTIQYGLQYIVIHEKEKFPVNIYYSKKKGVSYIIGGSNQSEIKKKLQQLLGLEIEPLATKPDWNVWLGTDESGKGDFFGSLVCAGFVCKKAMVNQLRILGVKDSKLLKDREIEEISREIIARFKPFIEIVILTPEKYNELYYKFSLQNKKLNELLAWMHTRIIKNLFSLHKFDGVLIDKFTTKKVIMQSFKTLPEVDIILQEKAEQDVAVATASIIARYHFLQTMKMLSKTYQMDFPKGANRKVIQFAKNFIERYDKETLIKVAKIHFKTYQEL